MNGPFCRQTVWALDRSWASGRLDYSCAWGFLWSEKRHLRNKDPKQTATRDERCKTRAARPTNLRAVSRRADCGSRTAPHRQTNRRSGAALLDPTPTTLAPCDPITSSEFHQRAFARRQNEYSALPSASPAAHPPTTLPLTHARCSTRPVEYALPRLSNPPLAIMPEGGARTNRTSSPPRQTLGQGTYAIVKEAVHIKTGKYYACKVRAFVYPGALGRLTLIGGGCVRSSTRRSWLAGNTW